MEVDGSDDVPFQLPSLKLTAKIGRNPKGKDRLPTINFQVAFAVSFRECIYLEPICPLFPSKRMSFSNQNKGHLGSRYTIGSVCDF